MGFYRHWTYALGALSACLAVFASPIWAADGDVPLTCRLSADHFRLRKWLFRDWLLTVFA
jgi:hypothetical protein